MIGLDRTVGQDGLTRSANRLNAELAELTAAQIESRLPAYAAAAGAASDLDPDGAAAVDAVVVSRVAERIARTLRESDAEAVEEVYSDGLLNVMEAPEFAQSEKLRRVFSALENRSYLGELLALIAGSGRIHVFIGHENAPAEMREVSLVLAPYGRPGRAVGVVGVLGPTRMAYSPRDRHGRLRVRADERARRPPVRLTHRIPEGARPDAMPHKTRAQERIGRDRHLADQAPRRDRPAQGRSSRSPTIRRPSTSPDSSASAPSSPNFRRRTADERERDAGLAADGLLRKVLALADDFDRAIDARPEALADDPWTEGVTAIDRKLRLLLESEGVSAIEVVPGVPFDPYAARGARQRARDRPARGRDRVRAPARLSDPRPDPATRDGRRAAAATAPSGDDRPERAELETDPTST